MCISGSLRSGRVTSQAAGGDTGRSSSVVSEKRRSRGKLTAQHPIMLVFPRKQKTDMEEERLSHFGDQTVCFLLE